MNSSTMQMLLAALIGIILLTVVVWLSQRGLLSFRYAMGWIAVASTGILAGLFIPFAQPLARALGLSSAALLAIIGLIFFVSIAIQLSISISGLQKQVRTLAEELARLRNTTTKRND